MVSPKNHDSAWNNSLLSAHLYHETTHYEVAHREQCTHNIVMPWQDRAIYSFNIDATRQKRSQRQCGQVVRDHLRHGKFWKAVPTSCMPPAVGNACPPLLQSDRLFAEWSGPPQKWLKRLLSDGFALVLPTLILQWLYSGRVAEAHRGHAQIPDGQTGRSHNSLLLIWSDSNSCYLTSIPFVLRAGWLQPPEVGDEHEYCWRQNVHTSAEKHPWLAHKLGHTRTWEVLETVEVCIQ